MGKAISPKEYQAANKQLHTCQDPACANKTRKREDDYCGPCKKAHKLVKGYVKTKS